MKKLSLTILFALLALSCFASVNPKSAVIPEIKQWKAAKGELVLDCDALKAAVKYAVVDNKALGDEGYIISVGKSGIKISANSTRGHFYADKTLAQWSLSCKDADGRLHFPCGEIRDVPDYGLRGLHLDCGRKFIPMDYLRDLVEVMAYYKMNTISIHLNDNGFKQFFGDDWKTTYSAFRMECETFPGLTARDGFYSKDEFREFIRYAASLGVEVIPEFDAPAHSLCFTQYKASLGSEEYGIDHLNLSNPEVYEFIDALYKEYLGGSNPVFCCPRMHVGTDEYSNATPELIAQFREFTDHCIREVEKYGKKACVWGALTHADGPTPVKSEGVDMFVWNNTYANPLDMAAQGYKIISIPDWINYIVPGAWYYQDFLDIEKIYGKWNPAYVADVKFKDGDPVILGGMFALWNDLVGNGVTVHDIHERLMPAIHTIAAKSWNIDPSMSFKDFDALRRTLPEADGINRLLRLEKPVSVAVLEPGMKICAELKGVAADYTVSFDIEWKKEAKGTVLFESEDAVFYLSDPVSGRFGYARDNLYLDVFNFRPYPGEKLSVKIVGREKETTLYVNGKKVESKGITMRYYNEGRDSHSYRAVLNAFPLERTGSWKSRITNFQAQMD